MLPCYVKKILPRALQPHPHIEAAAVSSVGCVRPNNEDNLCFDGKIITRAMLSKAGSGDSIFAKTGLGDAVFGVCDGMGGEAHGEIASRIAAQGMASISRGLRRIEQSALKKAVIDYVKLSGARINAEAVRLGVPRIGTTFCMMIVFEGAAYIANIGDSRVYLLRGGEIKRLTRDHNEAELLRSSGRLTAEEAASSPLRHVLTQYLGMPPAEGLPVPYLAEVVRCQPGDRFILCSDGLSGMVPDGDIIALADTDASAAHIAGALADAAKSAGGRDNISVEIVKIIAG